MPGGGAVALSTRGPSAFRVRFLPPGAKNQPIDTPMVAPDAAAAPFKRVQDAHGSGISATFGSVRLTSDGSLVLLDPSGATITKSQPLAGSPANDTCAARTGTDISGGTRVADPITVADEAACCKACEAVSECTNWVYGQGSSDGNCWRLKDVSGVHPASGRTVGGAGLGGGLSFSSAKEALLYGRGAGKDDATKLTVGSSSALVDNTRVYSPYYWSSDGSAQRPSSSSLSRPTRPCADARPPRRLTFPRLAGTPRSGSST